MGDDFDVALSVLVDDGVDFVAHAIADENHGAVIVLRQRSRVGDAACVNLKLETFRHFELVERQFVGGRRDWRRRHRRELAGTFASGRAIEQR